MIASYAHISTVTFSLYLFVLGLEMDPHSIWRFSAPANRIAYAGMISTVAVTVGSYTLINHTAPRLGMNHHYGIISAIAIGLSSTSSPILTRLTTELKINKSEIGRLAIRTGLANDMLCTLLLCAGVALHPLLIHKTINGAIQGLYSAVIIASEAVFITKVINPLLICKLNHRNPDRKPIRSFDMAVVCIVSFLLCYSSHFYGFTPSFNSFFVGLCLPRDGRLSNILISQCNFVLTTIMLPIYIVFVCLSSDYSPLIWPHIESGTVLKLAIIGSIGAVGKLTGTVAYGVHHGVQWPEAVALGLLLNVKGHFHIFCAHKAEVAGIIELEMMTVLGLVAVGTVIPMPLAVAFLRRRAEARERGRPMGLQWFETGREVKIVVGLHGPEDVGMAVNVMEAMREHAGGGGGGGMVAVLVDMVQMTDKAAASMVHGEGLETVTVTDEGIVEMREQIGSALEAYERESGGDVTVRRILAVSAFDDMHEDICSAARECMAVLVVLPFHCRQRVHGEMDAGHPGHRIINQKVLQCSPCSVGILVNRGLGRGHVSSLSAVSINVCAVFIGGGDDREALAYATRMARHPGVRLTVLRFVEDAAAAARAKPWGPGRRVLATLERQEMEQRSDEEFFAGFYGRYVAGGKGVGYVEKQVESGVDTVAVLRGVEAEYQLFVVGSGKERQSALTAGMGEWAEFPELGPIGDVMASSDFSASASVMVIQQHRVARRIHRVNSYLVIKVLI